MKRFLTAFLVLAMIAGSTWIVYGDEFANKNAADEKDLENGFFDADRYIEERFYDECPECAVGVESLDDHSHRRGDLTQEVEIDGNIYRVNKYVIINDEFIEFVRENEKRWQEFKSLSAEEQAEIFKNSIEEINAKISEAKNNIGADGIYQ